jgi:minimal PKS acyl carrier protein
MTLEDLRTIMRQCGVEEGIDLDSDLILDMGLGELGYDSLAILEITTAAQHFSPRPIPEDEATGTTTPRQLLEFVNEPLGVR